MLRMDEINDWDKRVIRIAETTKSIVCFISLCKDFSFRIHDDLEGKQYIKTKKYLIVDPESYEIVGSWKSGAVFTPRHPLAVYKMYWLCEYESDD